jgi:hypothetical protein
MSEPRAGSDPSEPMYISVSTVMTGGGLETAPSEFWRGFSSLCRRAVVSGTPAFLAASRTPPLGLEKGRGRSPYPRLEEQCSGMIPNSSYSPYC